MQSVALQPREARRKSPPALRTLVLNADYRPLSTYPLSIIAAQDAVSAIWRERVDVVEAVRSAGYGPGYAAANFPIGNASPSAKRWSNWPPSVAKPGSGLKMRLKIACTARTSAPMPIRPPSFSLM
jgi:hypothetical protein